MLLSFDFVGSCEQSSPLFPGEQDIGTLLWPKRNEPDRSPHPEGRVLSDSQNTQGETWSFSVGRSRHAGESIYQMQNQ